MSNLSGISHVIVFGYESKIPWVDNFPRKMKFNVNLCVFFDSGIPVGGRNTLPPRIHFTI